VYESFSRAYFFKSPFLNSTILIVSYFLVTPINSASFSPRSLEIALLVKANNSDFFLAASLKAFRLLVSSFESVNKEINDNSPPKILSAAA